MRHADIHNCSYSGHNSQSNGLNKQGKQIIAFVPSDHIYIDLSDDDGNDSMWEYYVVYRLAPNINQPMKQEKVVVVCNPSLDPFENAAWVAPRITIKSVSLQPPSTAERELEQIYDELGGNDGSGNRQTLSGLILEKLVTSLIRLEIIPNRGIIQTLSLRCPRPLSNLLWILIHRSWWELLPW